MSMLKRNQLFKTTPDREIVEKLVKFCGLLEIDDYREFSKKNLERHDTVEKFNEVIPTLEKYYINCKAIRYLKNLNEKKIITILRQFLREIDYKLISREKYIEGNKILLYHIEPPETQNDVKFEDGNIILEF